MAERSIPVVSKAAFFFPPLEVTSSWQTHCGSRPREAVPLVLNF